MNPIIPDNQALCWRADASTLRLASWQVQVLARLPQLNAERARSDRREGGFAEFVALLPSSLLTAKDAQNTPTSIAGDPSITYSALLDTFRRVGRA
jgi:hypothetical protein